MESKKINVITLFSGYDSQCMALDRLGIDYNLSAWAEIDKNAINAHNVVYPQWADRNVGDVSKVDWTTITDPIDLLTYSSPCFVAGTLVLTKRGYIPIEDVVIGDEVLTHANEYKKVLRIGGKESSDIYHINGMMFDSITCTGNHPFYVREMYRYGHKSVRMFKDAEWLEAGKLTKKHYLGYAINTESKYPEWNGVIDNRWGHGRIQNTLSDLFSKREFWYLMGRYVGDGWKKHSATGNGIIICCSERNEESLIGCLEALGFNYYKAIERTVTKITLCRNELYEFVGRYGYYAHGKVVDPETINLPVEMLKGFLDGVVDSDGCYTNNEYKISSVSKTLVYGLTQCIAKVHHTHVKMGFCRRKKITVIEGRSVNQRDTYSISWHPDERKQDHAFFEDGRVWFPISKITKAEETHHVYNLEVENDNSYTANGAIVHNCTDFSNAGLQKGGEKGSGTRSSLLWEVERAIETLHPKYLLLENVAALVGKKFLPLFKKWCDVLEGYGYSNTWQVMNAKDYGVPQNRKRVFLVSKLNDDTPYYFPKPFKLEKRLKDVLEDNVPETFYLSEDRIKGVVESMRKQREKGNGFAFRPKTEDDDVANSVTTGAGSRKTDNFIAEGGIVNVGQLSGSQNSRVIDTEGVSHTIANGGNDGIHKIIANTGGFGACYVSDVCLTIKSSSWEYNNALVEGVEKVGDLDPEHKWQGKVTHPHNLVVGTNGISPAILSTHGNHPFNVAEDPRVQCVGSLRPDNLWQGTPHYQDRVYSPEGISPTVTTAQGGNMDPKIVEEVSPTETKVIEDFYANRPPREYTEVAPTLRSERDGLKVMEPQKEERMVLGWSRDEKGNVVDRHPVEVANCVTVANRDNTSNYVVEKHLLNGDSEGNASTITAAHDFAGNIVNPNGGHKQMGVLEKTILNACADGTASALRSEGLRGSDKCITDPKGGFGKMGVMEEYPEETIRIRRLTPRELYRLMDVDEKNIDKLLASDIARTQHSKLAGNSIVVSCLYYIFKNLFEDIKEGPAEGEQLKLF